MGTSVGTLVFVKYGWRACAALNVGWMGFQMLVLLSRGPHCGQYTWVGYDGGLEWRRPKTLHHGVPPTPTEAESKASVTTTNAVGSGGTDSKNPEEDAALSSSPDLEKKQGVETQLEPVIDSSKEKVNE